MLGIASGAVAGLVAITPASGTAGPIGALLIGVMAGVLCFWPPPSSNEQWAMTTRWTYWGQLRGRYHRRDSDRLVRR
ncbi:MAG: hypothetical protein U1F42_10105 [Candidatus Competibacteraceae bacterium]